MSEDALSLADDETFNKEMEAIARIYSLRPGLVLTEDDCNAIQLYDEVSRRDDERAIDAYHRGYYTGMVDAAGSNVATLKTKVDKLKIELLAEKTLRRFDQSRDASSAKRQFRNLLCVMHSLDGHELPPWNAEKMAEFFANPLRFFLQADDETSSAVWAAMQARTAERVA